jgi:uncharacterized membrane protein YeaQ/YmgE (transglycosylase-associated protein family)
MNDPTSDLVSLRLVVALILGGVTGWLASILVKAKVAMGLWVSVAVGAVGSFLGVLMAGAFGVHAQTEPSWAVMGVTAVLSAAWLVGMLRAALGLFSRSGAY